MTKLPGFMFYPGDWQKDPNLRRATREEKGLLMDLLCLMFESHERGVLADASGAWTDDEIINALGGDPETASRGLAELVRKGVLSRRKSDSALFSRRLTREETLRQIRQENGRKGGNPVLLKQKSNQKVNQRLNQNTVNENERVVVLNTRKANYEEVKAFCSELSLPDGDSEYLFNHWEGNGWTNGGKPIKDWKRTIRAWKAAGHLPSQKNGSSQSSTHRKFVV